MMVAAASAWACPISPGAAARIAEARFFVLADRRSGERDDPVAADPEHRPLAWASVRE